MLDFSINELEGTLVIRLHGQVLEVDFLRLTPTVDAYLERHKRLLGVMVISKDWPGWDDFGAFASHMVFLRDHHQKISRIALVTDSVVGDLVPLLASHFLDSEIRHFSFAEESAAKKWLTG
jgi:hypothetical protein